MNDEKEVIILKCKTHLKHADYERLYNEMQQQAQKGVILLPDYIDCKIGHYRDISDVIINKDIHNKDNIMLLNTRDKD